MAFRALSDVMRVGAAVSAVAALVGIPSLGLGTRFLLVLLVLMIPRATGGVPAPLDLAFTATLLAAVWMSTADWYRVAPVAWIVHAVATGITAVVLHLVLARVGVLRTPTEPGTTHGVRVVGWTAMIGLIIGGLWEGYRWSESVPMPFAEHDAVDLVVHVPVGTVGALVAGLVLAAVSRTSRTPAADPESSSAAAPDRLRSIF
jgi:hypothetical protein